MIHPRTIDFAAMSDPSRNFQFARRWFEIIKAPIRPKARPRERRDRAPIRAWRAFEAPLDTEGPCR